VSAGALVATAASVAAGAAVSAGAGAAGAPQAARIIDAMINMLVTNNIFFMVKFLLFRMGEKTGGLW
jgi:hypothetical protein